MRILVATAAASLLTAAAAAGIMQAAPAAPRAEPATEAVPGLVYQSGKAMLRLTATPCPFKELRMELEREGIPPVRAYVVEQGSKQFVGCWSTDMGGDVMTLEPGRELGQIPVGWFRAPATPTRS
jgi:hypothetical protein